MPMTIACPGCAKQMTLGEDAAGRKARCKQCGQIFRIPMPPGAAAGAWSGSPPPIPVSSSPYGNHVPGLAPDDDPLPPPAPPRSSTTTRPIPPSSGSRTPRPPVRTAAPPSPLDDDDPLPPLAPPRRPSPSPAAPAYDDFEDDEVLDDEDRNSEPETNLPPARPSAVTNRPQRSSWPLALAALFGSGALGLCLVLIANHATSGRNAPGRDANIPQAAALAGFPVLPTAPANLVPAESTPPIRQDVVDRAVRSLRESYKVFQDLNALFRGVTDAESFQRGLPRLQQTCRDILADQEKHLEALPKDATRAEHSAVARQVVAENQEIAREAEIEFRRVERIPNLPMKLDWLESLIKDHQAYAQKMATLAESVPAGSQPFVEVFVRDVPDNAASNLMAELLVKQTDSSGGPAGQVALWSRSAASIRIWPVSDPQLFFTKAFGATRAKVEVRGHQLFVSNWQPGPDTGMSPTPTPTLAQAPVPATAPALALRSPVAEGFRELNAPELHLYPAGTPPVSVSNAPIRQDLVNHTVAVFRGFIKLTSEFSSVLHQIHDAASHDAIRPQLLQLQESFREWQKKMADLPRLSVAEDREVGRQLLGEIQAVTEGLRSASRQLERVPEIRSDGSLLRMVAGMIRGLEGMAASVNRPDQRPMPYIEVYVRDLPDVWTGNAAGEMFSQRADEAPGGCLSLWGATGSSFRVWPVSNPQDFSRRVFGNTGATVDIRGHQLFVSNWRPNLAGQTEPPGFRNKRPQADAPAVNVPNPAIRQDVVARIVTVFRRPFVLASETASIVRSVSDASSWRQAKMRIDQLYGSQPNPADEYRNLPFARPAEDEEIERQVRPAAEAAIQAVEAELARLERIPGLGEATTTMRNLLRDVRAMEKNLPSARNRAGGNR